MKNLIFRKANQNEVEDCFNLLKDRIAWMNKRGIKHWNMFDYLDIYPIEHFKRIQNDGDLFVLLDNDEIVCFAALLKEDSRWQCADNDSLYLHHFVSKVSDLKYGEEFMYRSFDYALSLNKNYLRLDSSKGYKALDDYYEKFNFVKVGEFKEGDYIGVLKELKLLNKKELRKKIYNIKLSEDYIKESSLIIEDKVLNSVDYKNAESIFVYISTNNEVSTKKIIANALSSNKKVYVPLCDGENMKAVLINSNTKFVENKFQILEPLGSIEEASDIDLAIIPCVSANFNLRRLGHGKGYYDRFLNKYQCKKIVLCFSQLIEDYIPMNDFDVYMDKLIQEKN